MNKSVRITHNSISLLVVGNFRSLAGNEKVRTSTERCKIRFYIPYKI